VEHASHSAALQDEERPNLPALRPREFWRMVAPWLGYVFLVCAGLLGLFTASAAADEATYACGLLTFAVAGVLIVVRMMRQLDGADVGFLLPIATAGIDTLVVTVAVLAVLGLVGAVLAAAVGGALYGIGLALFVICAALIFTELKRYFDRIDRAG
jgi:FtsH-binding integral membrane protein